MTIYLFLYRCGTAWYIVLSLVYRHYQHQCQFYLNRPLVDLWKMYEVTKVGSVTTKIVRFFVCALLHSGSAARSIVVELVKRLLPTIAPNRINKLHETNCIS